MRRSHRKPRNGYKECKNRHIKCDESHLTYINCVESGTANQFFSEDTLQKRVFTDFLQSFQNRILRISASSESAERKKYQAVLK